MIIQLSCARFGHYSNLMTNWLTELGTDTFHVLIVKLFRKHVVRNGFEDLSQ